MRICITVCWERFDNFQKFFKSDKRKNRKRTFLIRIKSKIFLKKKRKIMSNKTRNGVLFGTIMVIFLVTKGLLTTNILTTKTIVGIIVSALIAGTIGGFLFGWIINKPSKKKQQKVQEGVISEKVKK